MKVRYYIRQLPFNNTNIYKDLKFVSNLNLNDYVSVWTDEIEIVNDSKVELENACEELFRIFNIDHPKNFAGHSMSVSDVVAFRFGESTRFFYCDDCGFSEIKEKE